MMNRKILLPVVALICLLTKELIGVEFDNAQIDILTEGVLAIATLTGIFMNPKKK
jgi:hypothetical protein